MHLNLQPVEKKVSREDGSLEVFKIFRTIQGEGPLAGTPAIFVRLAGCDLACNFCDSDYTSHRQLMPVGEIIQKINQEKAGDNINLVVLTGGEPFRQDVSKFAWETIQQGNHVQIETNGTLFVEGLPYGQRNFSLVCSPKTPTINRSLALGVDAYKFVLAAGAVDPIDGLPTSALGMPYPPARPPVGFLTNMVFVQPLDEQDPEKNQAHLQAAISSCMKFGYRLSIQTHKSIGLE